MSNYVAQARSLAIRHHVGQFDKIGHDYFASHVEPVAHMVRSWGGTEYQVAAAYLHDLVEDTDVTFGVLRAHGFPDDVIDIVDALTNPGYRYHAFILRVTKCQPAVLVKLADITSNLDPGRLMYIEPGKRHRLVQKYTDALPVLWSAYGGR